MRRHPPTTTLPTVVRAALAALLLIVAVALVPASASAGGTPNLALAVDAQDSVLYGTGSTVRLTASTPPGSADAHNLSYRVVLPIGVSYEPGSAGAVAGAPTQLANQPSSGQTTLLWTNVGDVGGGGSHVLGFRVAHASGSFGVQGSFTIRGDAYAQDDPAYVPAFTATGTSDTTVAHPRTSFAENVTDVSRLASLSITKSSENTPEDKLLRGVHDQQTVHTLTVKGNAVGATTSTTLNDFLPAGVEFLGCGGAGADHTTNAPTNPGSPDEYPGAGPITVPATTDCLAPISVQTGSFDPDAAGTAFSAGVYTLVRWNLGTVPAGATVTIRYRAGIPLRRNSATWPGGQPSISGAQAANLNNNSGTEVADGELLTSLSSVTGFFYTGTSSVSTSNDVATRRIAKDLVVRKTAQAATLARGTITRWNLELRTSEYRDASSVVVTDTVPDGLCPLQDGVTLTAGAPSAADTTDCLRSGASATPGVPYSSATEGSDGRWSVVWNASTDPSLAQIGPSETHLITFPTAARGNYQEGFADAAPLRAGDVVTNAASVAASARVVCATGSACPPGAPTGTEIAHDGPLATGVTDTSSDRLTAATASLDQTVATTSSDCAAAVYADGVPAPVYRPGDRICWQLRVAYPAGVDSQAATITDYLPTGLAYDGAGFGTTGESATPADTAGAGPIDESAAVPGPGGALRWSFPGGSVGGDGVFERRVATRVQLPAGATPGAVQSVLAKSATRATGGGVAVLRDSAAYALTFPVMSAQKRVVAMNGTDLPTPVATQVVRGGDVVKMQVRLSNASADTAAERAEVWDRLPTGVTCADVTASGVSISAGGTCDPADQTVKWGSSPAIGPDVAPSSATALTYGVRVPTTTRPTQILTSSAGIRQYATTTNTGGSFTYVPSSNIDPGQNAIANVGPASSAATLTGAEPTITESRTTSITESSGGVSFNAVGEATIGETIHYTVRTVVPAGLTVDHFMVTDTVDARHIFRPTTLALTAGSAAVPAGGSLGSTGSDITLSLGNAWTAPTGADSVFEFEFDAIVADLPTNFRGGAPMSNQAKLGYDNPTGSPARNETFGPIVPTTVVEPVLGVNKTVDVGTNPVIGGQIVEYTVRLSAGSGDANPAHESTLVDVVPHGLTPVDAAGDPVADGAIVPDGDPALVDGVWSEATHSITFAPSATINPGSSNTFKYRTSVDIPPVAGTSLTNTAAATTTSIAGTPAAPATERTASSPRTIGYVASSSVTLQAKTASVTSTPSPATLTPGEQTTYALTVSIPANVVFHDMYVKDLLPPEMTFDEHVSQVCTAGCTSAPTTPTIQQYTPTTVGGGLQVVAWDLGDLTTSSTQTRTIVLTYKAHLRLDRRVSGTTIIRPATAASTATVASDRTDRVGAFNPAAAPTPAGGFDDTSAVGPASTSTITVVEPVMGIDKQVAVGAGSFGSTPVTVRDSDPLRYRVTVRNTGDQPAHDVQVRDVPPATFRNVTMTAGISATANDDPWAAPGDDIGWLIPGPIPANGSVVLEYTADLPVVTAMRDNDTFTNTATIQHAWGVSLANRTLRPGPQFGYRDYSVATIPALSRSTTATYDAPTISVNKTTGGGGFPEGAAAEVGKLFSWRVTVTNTSAAAGAKNVVLRDTLPRDWDYEPGTAAFTTGSTADPTVTSLAAGDQLTWATTIPLAPGASVVLTYKARPTLASATSIGTGLATANRHVNAATASVLNHLDRPADANGPFQPAGPDTAYAYLAVPIIGVETTPDAAPLPAAAGAGAQVAAGDPTAYTVRVRNTGTVAATNVLITTTLPTDALPNTYAPGSATAVPATGFTEVGATDATATFRLASVAVGATIDVRVPVRTDPASAENTELVARASVASDQTDPVVDNGTIRLVGRADLQATKTAPAAVNAGRALAYVVGARNLGPSVARDVVLTDVLPATVEFRPSPGCTAAGSAPVTVTCAFPGTTAVGSTVSATVNVRVRPGVTSDADNTVRASSATVDPVVSNDTATALVDVGELVDLSIVKTITGGAAGPTAADPWTKRVERGDTVAFPLTVVNAGPSDAPTAQLVDTLPAGLTYVSDTGGCTYAPAGRTLTCPIAGGLPATEPAQTPDPGAPKTITVVTTATGLGAQTNSASVDGGATAEVTPLDNVDTAVVTIDPAVSLGLTLSAPATVPAGGLLTYALTGTNAGKDAATAASFELAIPAGTTFESAGPGCTFTAGKVTCALGTVAGRGSAGTGPVGQAQRQVTVRVPIALADQAITANAAFASAETALSTTDPVVPAAASASSQVGPSADLSITQDAPAEVGAGGSITYTLVVRNAGPSAAPGVVVTNRLPGGVTLRSTSRPSTSVGVCEEAGGVLTCPIGTLAAGSSAVVEITVDVPAAMAGQTLVNEASVASPIVDPTPANASSSIARRLADPPPAPAPTAAPAPQPDQTPGPAPTPTPAPAPPGTANLSLAKKADGVARAGRELSYTITATNHGPAVAGGVVVTDALVGGVDFKSARSGDGKCGYERGTVRCRPGTLAVGESVNMRVIVVPSKTGMLVNDAVVSSDVTDPDLTDNRAVATDTVSPRPATKLSIKAAASSLRLRGGQRVTFTVKVRNTGEQEAFGVEVCDRLPAGMSFTSTKGGVLKGSRLCLTQASLKAGRTATFRVLVRLSARARKGKLLSRLSADAENAAQQNATTTATVITDGKVSAGMVRGFTG